MKHISSYPTNLHQDESVCNDLWAWNAPYFNKKPNLPATDNIIIDETNNVGKNHKKAVKANFLAVAALASSFEADEAILIVAKSMDTEWLFGRAWYILDLLEKSYNRTNMMAKARLRQAYQR